MLEAILREALASIPGCVAVAVVDLPAGTLVAIEAIEPRGQELLNILTAAVTELFEAPLLKAMSDIFPASQTSSAGLAFTELLLLNQDQTYLLMRGRQSQDAAAVFVASSETAPGLLLVKARTILREIERAL